jgi:hypothetical protein
MKIKLTKLHPKGQHPQGCFNNYVHDSSRSLYGYKQYRIKTLSYYKDWEVYDGEIQISPTGFGRSFKEAREWLENYLEILEGQNNVN